MKNIFLDLGTHYGQGLREFVDKFDMDESWEIYTFEANPVTYDKFIKEYSALTPGVRALNAAVSDHEGTITVNIETPPNEDDTGQGSSVISMEQWNPWGLADAGTEDKHFKRTEEVPCIDLSNFIKSNFNKEDNIIVKMDIEGSEYDVLERMIAEGTLEYVNNISVEWHSRFFRNVDEIIKRETDIVEKMKTYEGLILESWR
jgi:FkbM family methyltransferase